MWMGDYPSNPAYVLSSGEPLEDFLKNHPDVLGQKVKEKFGTNLPFLPKVSERGFLFFGVWVVMRDVVEADTCIYIT
jgi:hypothetical protein